MEVLLPCLRTLPICTFFDNEYDDEEVDEDHSEKPWVVDMCELMRPDDTSPNVVTTNFQIQPPPWKKCLLEWVT